MGGGTLRQVAAAETSCADAATQNFNHAIILSLNFSFASNL